MPGTPQITSKQIESWLLGENLHHWLWEKTNADCSNCLSMMFKEVVESPECDCVLSMTYYGVVKLLYFDAANGMLWLGIPHPIAPDPTQIYIHEYPYDIWHKKKKNPSCGLALVKNRFDNLEITRISFKGGKLQME